MTQPAWVITGPTAGIGRRTALELARHGARTRWHGDSRPCMAGRHPVTARARPSRRTIDPISPSVWRNAKRNTALKISAAVIARAE